MDCLTFTVEMTRALAWPLVAAGFLWAFNKPVLSALERIASLKLPGGIEATFENQIKAIVEKAKEIEPASKEVAAENDDDVARLIEMAATSPRGSIIEAWMRVEAAARNLAESSGISMAQRDPKRPYFNLQQFLKNNGLLEEPEVDMFRELRILRNRAAHASEFEITTESARQYIRLSDRLIDAIETVRRSKAKLETRPESF